MKRNLIIGAGVVVAGVVVVRIVDLTLGLVEVP